MAEVNDWNTKIIDEFRDNEGRVGGPFEGAPMLLLHHRGAKSGTERVNPLVYLPDDGRYVVFASKGGAPTNPDWYYNVIANPEATIEVGTDTVAVKASEATGDERERLWSAIKTERPGFAEYEQKTTRRIPVVVLQRVD
jgi:deazaflavin-dependent oxidoreductase (nitroreductase family)